jgi:hypothetical protein
MEPLRPDEIVWRFIIQAVAIFAVISMACFGAKCLGIEIGRWISQ